MKSIVVGVDGSPFADAALEAAVDLARESDASIHCVAVDDTVFHGGGEWNADLADEAAAAVRAAGLTADARALEGDPADRLLEVADDTAADLIVVGSHGRHALDALLFGSTSRKLVAHGGRSVLVVKEAALARQV